MGIYPDGVPRPPRRSRSFLARHATLIGPTVIVLAGVLAACGQSTDNNGGAAAGNGGGGGAVSQYASLGEEIYFKACARCHGNNREGDSQSPRLDATRIASLGEQPLQFVITYGKGEMPGFGGLTPEQLAALINYLRGY